MSLAHFDDPSPPDPSTWRAAVDRRARQLRHRRRASTSIAIVGPFAVACAAIYPVVRDVGRIDRVRISTLDTPPVTSTPSGSVVVDVVPTAQGRTRWLIIGTDVRPDGHALGVTGTAADTIMVVDVDADRDIVEITSIPRDTWIASAGEDGSRIGALYEAEDPSKLVAAVRDLIGAPINHYVSLDFAGFVAIADELGGLDLDFPSAARDRSTGFVAVEGCQHLAGDDLLAYVRSRHLEVAEPDGAFVAEGSADLGRTARQRDLAVRAIAQLSNVGVGDLRGVVSILAEHAMVEAGVSIRDLIGWVRAVRDATGGVTAEEIPVTPATVNGASVLLPGSAGDGSATTDTGSFLPVGECDPTR